MNDTFLGSESQLTADVGALTHSLMRSNVLTMRAACYGLYHRNLQRQSPTDSVAIAEAESKCIEAIQAIESGPDGDPLLHLRLPEFQTLRTSERFQLSFPVQ